MFTKIPISVNNKIIFNVAMLASKIEHRLSKLIGEKCGSDNRKFR
jgi:hypothetical protein